MDKEYGRRELEKMQAEMDALPIGYISRKKISGKEYFYRQWAEDGKTKSQYIKKRDLDTVRSQIARRKELQAILRAHRTEGEGKPDNGRTRASEKGLPEFETNVLTGRFLDKLTDGAKKFRERKQVRELTVYLGDETEDRVCFLLGLRRTGKSTIIYQVLGGLSGAKKERAAYIRLTAADTRDALLRDVKRLAGMGFCFIFLDEMPMWDSFDITVGELADIYGSMGVKIVVSPVHTAEAVRAVKTSLFDMVVSIYTTYLSFGEYSRLFDDVTIDDYLQKGGFLQNGNIWGEGAQLPLTEEQFVRAYIDNVICQDAGQEKSNVVRKMIFRMNGEFLVSLFSRDFKLYNWSAVAFGSCEPGDEIRYLEDLGLYSELEEIRLKSEKNIEKKGIFTIFWIWHWQVNKLLNVFLEDSYFVNLSERDKRLIRQRMAGEIREQMTAELVLLDTKRARERDGLYVRRFCSGDGLGSASGRDLIVYDTCADECWLYAVRSGNNSDLVPGWMKDEECRHVIADRFGRIIDCCVLYDGGEKWTEDGIHLQNVEKYLRIL